MKDLYLLQEKKQDTYTRVQIWKISIFGAESEF